MVTVTQPPVRQVPPKRFVPIADNIACHVYKQTETAGGVLIPDNAKTGRNSPRLRVIAVGPDVKQVKEGDLVITFADVGAFKMWYNNEEFIVLPEKVVGGIWIEDERDERAK